MQWSAWCCMNGDLGTLQKQTWKCCVWLCCKIQSFQIPITVGRVEMEMPFKHWCNMWNVWIGKEHWQNCLYFVGASKTSLYLILPRVLILYICSESDYSVSVMLAIGCICWLGKCNGQPDDINTHSYSFCRYSHQQESYIAQLVSLRQRQTWCIVTSCK